MKNQSVLSSTGVHNSDYIVVLFLEKANVESEYLLTDEIGIYSALI